MRATGLFFLRARPYVAHDQHGVFTLLLPVVEHEDRDGVRVTLNTLLAGWKGPAASTFWNLHMADLKPGRGIELELDRLRGHEGEWKASVTRASLAPLPPSWQKQADEGAGAAPTDQPPQA